jgi:tRNA threonylcarbamoyladenosine dehydratase
MADTSWLSRTKLIVGEEGIDKLQQCHVLVVGLGGVGSYAAELICRGGVGSMTIIDGDIVEPSNRNRQLPALFTTHNMPKAEVMKERLLAINPELKINAIQQFMEPDRMEIFLKENKFDYVVDCIDSLTPKVTMLIMCYNMGIKVVSSMGAGGKIDPTQIRVTDISKTYMCNLALVVRKRLKKVKIYNGIKAVFSGEKVIEESLILSDGTNYKKSAFGTMSYLPAAFGCSVASVVLRDLLEMEIK